MELMDEQQFNALSEAEKYAVYKDLVFKRDVTKHYEWESVCNGAKNGNLFNNCYYSDFVKEAVDKFGYEYVVEKLVESQTKESTTDE